MGATIATSTRASLVPACWPPRVDLTAATQGHVNSQGPYIWACSSPGHPVRLPDITTAPNRDLCRRDFPASTAASLAPPPRTSPWRLGPLRRLLGAGLSSPQREGPDRPPQAPQGGYRGRHELARLLTQHAAPRRSPLAGQTALPCPAGCRMSPSARCPRTQLAVRLEVEEYRLFKPSQLGNPPDNQHGGYRVCATALTPGHRSGRGSSTQQGHWEVHGELTHQHAVPKSERRTSRLRHWANQARQRGQ